LALFFISQYLAEGKSDKTIDTFLSIKPALFKFRFAWKWGWGGRGL